MEKGERGIVLQVGDMINVEGTIYGMKIGICLVESITPKDTMGNFSLSRFVRYNCHSLTLDRTVNISTELNSVTLLSRTNDESVSR